MVATGQRTMDAGMSPDEFLSDYTEDVSQDDDPSDALAIIENSFVRLHDVSQQESATRNGINLPKATVAEVRQLRRALNKLARLGAAAVVDRTPQIIGFIPVLTPNVARYLAAVDAAVSDATAAIDSIISTQALNSWQQGWLLTAIRGRIRNGAAVSSVQTQWVARVSRE